MTSTYHLRLRNQANSYARIIYILNRDIRVSGKPADRVLRSFFRKNKKFGASDRRVISDTVYKIFRWWGWLRLIPDSEEQLWRSVPEATLSNKRWLSILLAAHVLESTELHPVVVYWKELLRKRLSRPHFIEGLHGKPLAYRADYLGKLFKISKPDCNMLVPLWFMGELERAKADIPNVIDFMQRRPPLWIRSQTQAISVLKKEFKSNGLDIRQSKSLLNAFRLENPRVNLYELPGFQSGKFEVQDIASQVIGIVCDARPGQRWWDVCAGAGGKTLQLASLMKNKGSILATDIRSWKYADLKRRARRSRFFNITTKNWDGNGIPVRTPNFDGVLVDAPCSGTGTWRRNPDGRWSVTRENLYTFPDLQYRILANAAKAVRRGGLLIYATCSICACEDEDVIHHFLNSNSGFSLEELAHPLTGEKVNGIVRVWPQMADSDAIFVAKMRKVRECVVSNA